MTLRNIFLITILTGIMAASFCSQGVLETIPKTAPTVFLPDENIEIAIDFPTTRTTSAQLDILDFQNRIVFQKRFLPSEIDQKLTVKSSMKNYGVFRANLTWNEKDGTGGSSETTFARIRDVRLTKPKPESPFGIGAYYAMRFNPEELKVAVKLQQMLGAAWNRDELLWDIVEPKKGEWTFDKTDRAVKACREHNIHILGLLDYWGRWAEPLADDSYDHFANYCKKMVNRYKPGGAFPKSQGWGNYGIKNWEVWNEPATFWTGSGTEFGRLLQAASAAIKSSDPDARVFFSEAGETFNRDVIARAGTECFEGITPHYYCPPRTPEEGDIDTAILETPSDFASIGVYGKEFWVSEFGWHSTMEPGQMMNQAVNLVRSHVYGLAAGLDKFFWYNFVNDTRDKNAQHYGLINREDWTPRYGYGAYSSMVWFLEDSEFFRRVEILKPARIFVFQKGTGSVAVLWSSGPEGFLKAEFPPEVRMFDMMSNPLPGDAVPLGFDPVYLVAEKIHPMNLAAKLEAGKIEGISAASLRIQPFSGALKDKPHLTVEVENVGNTPISGYLKIRLPEEWSIRRDTLPVKMMDPGKKEEITFIFSEMKQSKDNLYPVEVIFREHGGGEAIVSRVLTEMVATYGTPTIDGDDSDWKGARFLTMDKPEYAVGLVPYMEWNLSCRFATLWDKDNFYFLGVVRDNNYHQPQTGSLIWQGDSFQIAFDCVNAGEQVEDGKGQYLYGLAHTSKGDETWRWPAAGSNVNRAAPAIKLEFSNPEKDLYIYEAAIPRNLLSPMKLEEGTKFGFTILLNDNDGGGRRGWLEWTPGIGTGFAPKYFTTWTLIR